jgi:hypothetical protein
MNTNKKKIAANAIGVINTQGVFSFPDPDDFCLDCVLFSNLSIFFSNSCIRLSFSEELSGFERLVKE